MILFREFVGTTLCRLFHGLPECLYRTLEVSGNSPLKDAHAALDAAVSDAAVLDAYGFSPIKDLFARYLELNLAVADREREGQPVTAPGVPTTYGDATPLITDDCIRP